MPVSLLFPHHSGSACTVCGVSLKVQNDLLFGQDPEICATALKIVVWALESPKPNLIRYLKDFLAALPAPLCIQQVLLQGICQLAEQNSDICRQVLLEVAAFQPQLHLRQVVQQAVMEFLQLRNFVLNQDYQVDDKGQLQLNDATMIALLTELTEGDRLLVTELLSLP